MRGPRTVDEKHLLPEAREKGKNLDPGESSTCSTYLWASAVSYYFIIGILIIDTHPFSSSPFSL